MLTDLVIQYGYVMVVAGVIVEGDATLVTASILAHRGYMKLGLRASTELTRKFVDAAGIGFALGSKTGFAVADVDNKIPGMARRVPEFRPERLPFVRIRGARQ